MSKRPKPNKLANQLTLGMDPTDPETPVVGEPHPEIVPGGSLCKVLEFSPANFDYYFSDSENDNKDILQPSETAFMDGLSKDWDEGNFVANGDAVIFDRQCRLIEGFKRCAVGRESSYSQKVLVIQVDKEARFFTGRPRRNNAKDFYVRPEPGSIPPRPLALDLTGLPPGAAVAIRGAVSIRDGLAAFLGHDILRNWTTEGLIASHLASAGLARSGIPTALAVFVHACLTDLMPPQAHAFFDILEHPARAPRSAPAFLARHLATPGVFEAVHELLTVIVCAAESFVADDEVDPVTTRSLSSRGEAQLLQVLVGANGRLPERLLTLDEETIPRDSLPAILLFSGLDLDKLKPKDVERMQGMIRDIRRHKGLFLNGEPIKVTGRGKVLDGRLRLAACYLAGFDAHVHVARGFREDFRHMLPRGRAQSMGHRLYAEGYLSPYDFSGVLNYVYSLTENIRGIEATVPHLRHLMGQHAQIQQTVLFVHPLKIKNEWRISKAVLGAAHLLMTRYSRQLADSFVSELIEILELQDLVGNAGFAADLNRHKTLRLFADRLRAVYVDKSMKHLSGEEVLCNAIETMNAWCREAVLDRFSPMPNEGYPYLRRPPGVTKLMKELQFQAAHPEADRE